MHLPGQHRGQLPARIAGAVLLAGWALIRLEARRSKPAATIVAPPRQPKTPEPVGAAGVEIERKFLAPEAPSWLDAHPGEEIEQGYLAIDGPVELRLRRRGDRSPELTLKTGSGERRTEDEFELTEARFAALWPATAGRRLRKMRYRVPTADGQVVEFDVYGGWLTGLVTAEVEFESPEASAAFQPPAWLGIDITDDPSYSNQQLAQREARERARRVFRLRTDEQVPDGIRRIALGQIDEVLDRVANRTEEDFGTAVHESRKSLKRLRAVARLVRDDLGSDVFRFENAGFRDMGRALSGPRDSQVLIQALDSLTERYALELDHVDLATFRSRLVVDHEALRSELSAGAPALAELETGLRAARERVADWPLSRSGFGSVQPGLKRTYRDGRRAYRVALTEPTPDALHEWRKRTKDLWYSLQILQAAAPRRMKALAGSAHRLSDLLGDDHDLVVLQERAESERPDFPDERSAAVLHGLTERRRGELQIEAFGLGWRLYGDSTSTFAGRIERGWLKRVQGR